MLVPADDLKRPSFRLRPVLVCVQPPDAENCTSGGVGALTGANPVRATRSNSAT